MGQRAPGLTTHGYRPRPRSVNYIGRPRMGDDPLRARPIKSLLEAAGGLNMPEPLSLFVLTTTTGDATTVGHRAFLFTDEQTANALGERLRASKPAEATSFEYTVLPVEGPPA